MTAEGDLRRAAEQVRRTRNELTAQAADAFGRFQTARYLMRSYQDQILPDLARSYRGVYERHQQEPDQVGFSDIIVAQQNLAAGLAAYVGALGDQWTAVADIANLMQVSDLSEMNSESVPGGAELLINPALNELDLGSFMRLAMFKLSLLCLCGAAATAHAQAGVGAVQRARAGRRRLHRGSIAGGGQLKFACRTCNSSRDPANRRRQPKPLPPLHPPILRCRSGVTIAAREACPLALPLLGYDLAGPPRGTIQPDFGQEYRQPLGDPTLLPAIDVSLTQAIDLYRPDGLAPAGVRGDHTLKAGRALLSYRYDQGSFDDNFRVGASGQHCQRAGKLPVRAHSLVPRPPNRAARIRRHGRLHDQHDAAVPTLADRLRRRGRRHSSAADLRTRAISESPACTSSIESRANSSI